MSIKLLVCHFPQHVLEHVQELGKSLPGYMERAWFMASHVLDQNMPTILIRMFINHVAQKFGVATSLTLNYKVDQYTSSQKLWAALKIALIN